MSYGSCPTRPRVKGLLLVEHDDGATLSLVTGLVPVLYDGLEEVSELCVVGDEAFRDEAGLPRGDVVKDHASYAFSQDSREDFVVSVKEGDGSVVADICAILLLIEDGDLSLEHSVCEGSCGVDFLKDAEQDGGKGGGVIVI